MQTPTSVMLSDYLKHTKDKTPENIALGKARMDYYYTFLLAEANNYVIERTKYSKLKADQRSFLLPPDYMKIKRVRVKIGGVWYKLTPNISLDNWAEVTAYDTITTSIPSEFNVINEQGNMHIELSDIPNLDSTIQNFEIIYEGYQDPLLFPSDYTTGSIALIQGQAIVSGTDTVWTDNMVGRFIKPTGGKFYYEIADVGSARTISLVNYFQDADIANTPYIIAEIPRLPHEYHKTPVWGAVQEYYLPNNAKKAQQYERLYARDLLMLQNKYSSKTKGRVTPGRRVGGYGRGVPRNYPLRNIG